MMIAALRRRKILSVFCFKNSSSLPNPKCNSHLDLDLDLDLVLVFPLGHHFSTSASAPNPNPILYEFLVHTHHFSPKSASQIASLLTPFSNPQRSHSILSFFKQTGFSTPQLEKTLKVRPRLLCANLDKVIKPKFKFFHDLGLSCSDFADIVARDPIILTRSLKNRVIPNVCVLNKLLGSKDELARFLKVSAWFLFSDLDNTLLPNIELLSKCGVTQDQILMMMHQNPRFMLRKHKDMKKCVERVDSMGVRRSSKVFIHAVRVINSMSDKIWELKLRTLQEAGLSDDDIAAIFRKTPLVFALSEEKIKKTKEFLLENGKYKLSNIINNPASLGLSIEKRYKPRFQVLELLEAKKLIQNWPFLASLFKMKDKEFFDLYVVPFRNEIGDVYELSSHKGFALEQ